ncbi:MAG: class I SAM-dependent methyltransferase [Hyphomicrobium sp.]
MSTADTFALDETGKIDITDIYNKPDPRRYYSTLRHLEYQIPGTAKPVFQRVINAYRHAHEKDKVRVLDVGCSYGVNAAILKCDLGMDQLYDLYACQAGASTKRDQLLAHDQSLMDECIKDGELEVVGLDISKSAIDYAVEAHLLDDGVAANLETGGPPPEAAAILDEADLVISTGCIGYVGRKTLKGILDANAPRKPWMTHFVLRMFPFDEISELLEDFGYVTEKVDNQTFVQRRFASEEEQEHVLQRLSELGIDASGLEADGWYHAEAFISRPVDDRASASVGELAPSA